MFQEEKGRPSCVETKHSHPGETMSDSNWQVVQLGMGGRSQRTAGKVPRHWRPQSWPVPVGEGPENSAQAGL